MAEVLVHPLMKGEVGMARRYRDLLNHMGCLSFGPDEAWAFAELRAANPSLKPPDAVQLACASVRGVELFVTNDARLRSLRVSGIKRIESLASAVADEG
jgi:predicted nucleic acid-binding protein